MAKMPKPWTPETVSGLKPDPANPRKITETAAEKLARSMEEFGDLSGVVRNVVTDELVGGHQRVARFVADNPPVTVTERFDETTAVGTLAHGFVTWRGERWSYREVAWERPKQVAANIAANNPEMQGEFSFPILADAVAYLEGEGYDASLTGFDEGQREQIMTWTPDDPPADFKKVDESLAIEHRCPQCGYEWSGRSAPVASTAPMEEE